MFTKIKVIIMEKLDRIVRIVERRDIPSSAAVMVMQMAEENALDLARMVKYARARVLYAGEVEPVKLVQKMRDAYDEVRK